MVPSEIRYWLTFGVFISAFFVSISHAQEVQPELDRLYQQALKTNPEIQVLQQGLHVSEQDIVIAGYIPNPTLQLYAGYGKMTTQLGNPQQIGLQQLVEAPRKHDLRKLKARTQYEGTQITLQQATWQVHNRLRLAYLDYLSALSHLEQLRQQVTLVDELVHIAEARSQAGASPEADAIQTRLVRHQLNPELIQAQNDIRQTTLRLLQGVGILPESSLASSLLTPNSSIEPLEQVPYWPKAPSEKQTSETFDTLKALSQTHRQELKVILNELAQSQIDLKLAQWARLPDPQVGAGFLFVHTTTPVAQVVSDKGNFFGGYASLQFTLPVFNNQQGEIAQNKAKIRLNELALQSTQFAIESSLIQAIDNIRAQQESLEIFRDQLLPESMEVLHLADIGYRYGKTGLSSVILARQSFQAVQSDYLYTLTQTWRAWARLEQETGLPLEVLLQKLGWPLQGPVYQRPALSMSTPVIRPAEDLATRSNRTP